MDMVWGVIITAIAGYMYIATYITSSTHMQGLGLQVHYPINLLVS